MQISKGDNSPNQNAGRDINNKIYYQDDIPIMIDPEEMFRLINFFYNDIHNLEELVDKNLKSSLKRTNIYKKNEINGMSKEYYETAIKKYAVYFNEIENFLSNPINEKENARYQYIVNSINNKLIAYRDRFDNFNEVVDYVIDRFINSLSKEYNIEIEQKILVKIFFAYMYFCCDAGESYENKT